MIHQLFWFKCCGFQKFESQLLHFYDEHVHWHCKLHDHRSFQQLFQQFYHFHQLQPPGFNGNVSPKKYQLEFVMFQGFIYNNLFRLNISFAHLIHHPPSNVERTCYINRCVCNVGLAIWITISWKENFHTNFCISKLCKRCKGACPKPSGIDQCGMLKPWNMVDIVKQFCSIYFVTVANVILLDPYVKATYMVLSALSNQILSDFRKNLFFLDKVSNKFSPLRSCRWFDNNRFTSLTLPVIPPLNFSLSTISLVENDISTVHYAPIGPLSESDIAGPNQVLW
jgi:hypothetical protein